MSNNYQCPKRNNSINYDIHQRIFQFIVRVLNFLNTLSFTYANQVCKNQITRSVTSMGANDQEADGASTSKDFLHKLTIVRKESKETLYWLKLIQSTNSFKSNLDQLIQEGNEINAIVSTIIKNSTITMRSKLKD